MWYDGAISAGEEWDREIRKHLNNANIILLLISSDFIDSNYCYSTEMQQALERHKRREAMVIPIILRHVSGWKKVPPGNIQLGQLQALPKEARPITSWTNHDEAWIEVVEGVGKVVSDLTRFPPQRHKHLGRRFPLLIEGTLGFISLLVVLIIILKQTLFVPAGLSLSQISPGCGTSDPRISWTTNQAQMQCMSDKTLLTKIGDWNGHESSRLGQLILLFPHQSFPAQFHLTVTILDLWDPYELTDPGGNHGGCGSVTVHISNDHQTYDSLFICRDGWYGYRPVVGGLEGAFNRLI